MTITTFAEAEQVLARVFANYTPRPQQQRLATAVENLFSSTEPIQLMGEAGCGVGKSFATAIPAILSGRRTIIATATKALQEQLASKDMPFLQENLPVSFTWALLKGRSNYVCKAKLNEANSYQISNIDAVRTELGNEEHSGDFEHLTNQVADDKRYLLSMSSEECPGKRKCPFGEVCFAERAKEIAKQSDVVVTNTAMLMTDLRLRELTDDGVQMLGDMEVLVVDEAHELPEIAASALADRLTRKGLESLISQGRNFLGDHDGKYDLDAIVKLDKIVDGYWTWLADLNRGENRSINPGDQVEITHASLMERAEDLVEIIEILTSLRGDVECAQVRVGDPKREQARQQRIVRQMISMTAKLTDLLVTTVNEGDPGTLPIVRWVESTKTRKGELVTSLYWSPVDVAPFLRRVLWTQYPVALISATLSVGGDFSYMKETLGLDAPVELNVGTPFDYADQARLFVPDKNQPEPSPRHRSMWEMYARATTLELVKQTGGGALLLFTSRSNMRATYAAIEPVLRDLGINCFMQGEHGSNKELARLFSEDTHSVLFALKSFMTGVDFSGETCRLVVVDKLPFPVPTEIMFAARSALINRRAGRDVSFGKLTIPMMSLTLIQAFGRLVRSQEDKGIVAILDPRLSSKGYGKTIVKSLPPAPITHDITEAARIFTV